MTPYRRICRKVSPRCGVESTLFTDKKSFLEALAEWSISPDDPEVKAALSRRSIVVLPQSGIPEDEK